MAVDVINIVSLLGGAYFGFWKLCIKSIILACMAFDAGTLTGSMIFWTIFKCVVLSPVVTWGVYFILVIVLAFIYSFMKEILK